jgi:positive regulator of sigma E activity
MTPFVKKDSVWFGIAIGLLVPAAVYALLITIYTLLDSMGIFSDVGFAEDFRIRTLALFAIVGNLIMMQRFRNSYRHETMRGILIASMILVMIWFFIFGIKIIRL